MGLDLQDEMPRIIDPASKRLTKDDTPPRLQHHGERRGTRFGMDVSKIPSLFDRVRSHERPPLRPPSDRLANGREKDCLMFYA